MSDCLSLLTLKHRDVVEEGSKVLQCHVGSPPVLINANVIRVHIVEPMDEILHQNHLAMTTQFQNAQPHFKRMISKTVHLCNHKLARRQTFQHRIRCIERRHDRRLVRVASFSLEAGRGKD